MDIARYNIKLYETDIVVGKYTSMKTRVRQLNNAEKEFVDKYNIVSKKILVLGSGCGRVPVNFLLFNNEVIGVERSQKLHQKANQLYPKEYFKRLELKQGNATDLREYNDNSFDLVFFPQNGIDYIFDIDLRERAILEMSKKVKDGGLLVFTSHNCLAYGLSFLKYKGFKHRQGLFVDYLYIDEPVVGGGFIFKGNPRYIIRRTEALTGFRFIGFTCDARNRFSRKLMHSLFPASFVFEYILYVFRK